jgi:hypothetical protein
MVFAPLEGWRHVKVTDRRTAIDYAQLLRQVADIHFSDAAKIVLVQDNLNTHGPASLYEAFPAAEARRLVERFEWHYTPKHGSWLDLAESELGHLTKQCLDRRIPDKQALIKEIAAWEKNRNKNHSKANWHFTTEKARAKLKTSTLRFRRFNPLGRDVGVGHASPSIPTDAARSGPAGRASCASGLVSCRLSRSPGLPRQRPRTSMGRPGAASLKIVLAARASEVKFEERALATSVRRLGLYRGGTSGGGVTCAPPSRQRFGLSVAQPRCPQHAPASSRNMPSCPSSMQPRTERSRGQAFRKTGTRDCATSREHKDRGDGNFRHCGSRRCWARRYTIWRPQPVRPSSRIGPGRSVTDSIKAHRRGS